MANSAASVTRGSITECTAFAAENVECVFVSGANPQVAGDYARNVRAGMADDGRQADDVLVAPA
jgi:alkanesulfonate monooxygenase SsuD/methylene tetrahydromethanopterin reductase-like flavin-dependent oxidoreductase (luciferase family)